MDRQADRRAGDSMYKHMLSRAKNFRSKVCSEIMLTQKLLAQWHEKLKWTKIEGLGYSLKATTLTDKRAATQTNHSSVGVYTVRWPVRPTTVPCERSTETKHGWTVTIVHRTQALYQDELIEKRVGEAFVQVKRIVLKNILHTRPQTTSTL